MRLRGFVLMKQATHEGDCKESVVLNTRLKLKGWGNLKHWLVSELGGFLGNTILTVPEWVPVRFYEIILPNNSTEACMYLSLLLGYCIHQLTSKALIFISLHNNPWAKQLIHFYLHYKMEKKIVYHTHSKIRDAT